MGRIKRFAIGIAIGIIVSVIVLAPVLASLHYTVSTGNMSFVRGTATIRWAQHLSGWPGFIRWPSGVMHTVFAKLGDTTTQEIWWGYSSNGGSTWTETQLTSIGFQQESPSIAQQSFGDLHVAWTGEGGGNDAQDWKIRYMSYDASTGTWSSPAIIFQPAGSCTDYYGYANPRIYTNSDDDLILTFVYYNFIGGVYYSWLYLTYNLWDDNTQTFGGWQAVTQVANYSSNCAYNYDVAIDQSNNIGIVYGACNSYPDFKLYDWGAKTLGSKEDITATRLTTDVSLITGIVGGVTRFYCLGDEYLFSRPIAGSWNELLTPLTAYIVVAVAQEHGTDSDNTGNIIVVGANDVVDEAIHYAEYQLGVGWGAEQTVAVPNAVADDYFLIASNQFYPFDEANNWHYNWPATGAAILYYDEGANAGYDDGDEVYRYLQVDDSWGTFSVSSSSLEVVTKPATYIAMTSARLNGYVKNDGGSSCATRFRYRVAAGPGPWGNTTMQSGKETGDYFYANVSSLTASTTYDFQSIGINGNNTDYGAILQFTTSGTIGDISTFTAIPRIDSPSIDLKWLKPAGSPEVMVRAKIGSYPGNTTDGILVCQTINNAYSFGNLTAGDTWWFAAWGVSGTTYSTTPAYAIATVSLVVEPGGMESPTGPTNWLRDVDYTNLSGMPGYEFWNWVGNSFGFNLEFWWGLTGFIGAMAVFMLAYIVAKGNMMAAGIAAVVILGIEVPMGLMAGFMVFLWAFVVVMYAIQKARA